MGDNNYKAWNRDSLIIRIRDLEESCTGLKEELEEKTEECLSLTNLISYLLEKQERQNEKNK
jgi:hypothetical protein